MRVIGCLCYVTNLLRTDKLGPWAIKSVLMDYGTTERGYKLYDLQNKMFFINRDVVFTESYLSFQTQSTENLQDLVAHSEFQVSVPSPLIIRHAKYDSSDDDGANT